MRSAMQPHAASCMSNVSLVRDARRRFTAGAGVSRVLLAVDDVALLERVAIELAGVGIAVEAAPTFEACMRAIESGRFEILVLDLRLGTRSGLDVVRELRGGGLTLPFMTVADRASMADVVEAVRLGATTVIDKSAGPEELVAAIIRELRGETIGDRTPAPDASLVSGAPARRWASYVVAATNAPADPRTLADWSRAIGVSRSVLVESCARLGIVPRDARDLARLLRLVRRAEEPWDPETALDVADRRTLRALLVRAGLSGGAPRVRPTARQFLANQQFVEQTNAGLAALLLILEDA